MAGGECHIGAEWDGQKWLLEYPSIPIAERNGPAGGITP